MKLVTVLMLTALPLYCYAGLGCDLLGHVINVTIDPNVNMTEYTNHLQELSSDKEIQKDFAFMKECFLQQSEETLGKVQELQQAIYDSFWCARY